MNFSNILQLSLSTYFHLLIKPWQFSYPQLHRNCISFGSSLKCLLILENWILRNLNLWTRIYCFLPPADKCVRKIQKTQQGFIHIWSLIYLLSMSVCLPACLSFYLPVVLCLPLFICSSLSICLFVMKVFYYPCLLPPRIMTHVSLF